MVDENVVVHDPGGLGFRIERIWAYVAVHDDGDEGICAFQGPFGMMPMIGADLARVMQLRETAEKMARTTGKPIRLVRFDNMTVVEEFKAKE